MILKVSEEEEDYFKECNEKIQETMDKFSKILLIFKTKDEQYQIKLFEDFVEDEPDKLIQKNWKKKSLIMIKENVYQSIRLFNFSRKISNGKGLMYGD
jgi:hypothetical protein